MKYEPFFRRATGEEKPFPYQIEMAMSAEIPQLLNAPTGAGKTAGAILGWLWRRTRAQDKVRKATPRRLIYCLPMRVLVEQTRSCAERWLRNLGLARDVGLHVLMGGEETETGTSNPNATPFS